MKVDLEHDSAPLAPSQRFELKIARLELPSSWTGLSQRFSKFWPKAQLE